MTLEDEKFRSKFDIWDRRNKWEYDRFELPAYHTMEAASGHLFVDELCSLPRCAACGGFVLFLLYELGTNKALTGRSSGTSVHQLHMHEAPFRHSSPVHILVESIFDILCGKAPLMDPSLVPEQECRRVYHAFTM